MPIGETNRSLSIPNRILVILSVSEESQCLRAIIVKAI